MAPARRMPPERVLRGLVVVCMVLAAKGPGQANARGVTPLTRSGAGVAEADGRDRAAPGGAVQPDRPAEAFAETAHDGQAHALARQLVRVGPVERVEHALQDLRRHPDAGI